MTYRVKNHPTAVSSAGSSSILSCQNANSKRILGLGLACAVAVFGCRDIEGPISHPVLTPVPRLSNETGPPTGVFTIPAASGWPPTQTSLLTFPWDTWVTLVSSGTVHLNAKPKLPNGGGNYVEAGDFGATGGWDHHDSTCFLNLKNHDLPVGNLPSFGQCEAAPVPAQFNSVKNQAPWIVRSPMPTNHPYECSNDESVICHWMSGGGSTVTETAIQVTLNKPTPSQLASTFATPQTITFTATKSPDSVHVSYGTFVHPMAITDWQWIGADSTRNATQPWAGPCHANFNIHCTYTAYESGRMVLKAFTGGWAQSSSVTVQCLTGADPALDDSLNDFRVRQDLLNVLVTSNADASADAGWAGTDWDRSVARHESGGVIWLLPDGRYYFAPWEDPNSTAVHYDPPDSLWSAAAAPVPGAVPYATVHDHPTKENTIAYGWPDSTRLPNGVWAFWAQFPGDTLPNGFPAPVASKAREDSATWRGDSHDRAFVAHTQLPDFQITNHGFIWRLNYPQTNPPTATPFRPSGGSEAQRKCAWVERYAG